MISKLSGKSTILFTILALCVARVAATGCEHYGHICPKETPCCNQGWCHSEPSLCAAGCEPFNSFSADSCMPSPGCVSFRDDFNDPTTLVPLTNFSGSPFLANWTSDFEPNYAYISNGMLVLEMHQDMTKPNQYGKYQGFGATVSSIRSIVKGNLTARLRTASSSPGVVSSWITRNKHGDELDFEFVGKSPHQVQTNWYYNNVIDWTHGKYFDMPQLGDLNASFHEYMISWGDMQARWFVDGQCMGVLELNESDMFSRPQQWHFSVWDGGSGSPDTTNWAGGPTDWSDVNRIYRMEVDWVQVQCSQEMTGDQRKTEWDVWHRPNASTSVPGAETSLGPFPSIPPVPTSGSKGLLGDFWVLAVVVVVVVVEVITYLIFSI